MPMNSFWSYQISPFSGSYSPTRLLSRTVLPLPLAPIIKEHSPGSKRILISSRTCLPLNSLYKCFTSIIFQTRTASLINDGVRLLNFIKTVLLSKGQILVLACCSQQLLWCWSVRHQGNRLLHNSRNMNILRLL